ncbi:MAG: BolA family protein [Betaproteobacteria bacterium]|jgi:BolA protein
MTDIEQIQTLLASLEPESLEILDDSEKHRGHPGAQSGGGHYSLHFVSAAFEGLNRMARHRLVYEKLHSMMGQKIHALSIKVYSPTEV